MASRREKKREQREKLILKTAADLISAYGFSHINMDMLADEVGISKTTLYQHFSNKEDVVLNVLHRSFNNVEAFMRDLPDDSRAIDRIEAMMRYMMQSGYGADGFPLGMVRDDVVHAFVHDAEVSQRFRLIAQQLFTHIDEAKADGDIDAELPPDLVISALMTLIGMADSGKVWPMTHRHDAIIDHAVRIFRHGVAPNSQ